MKRMEWNGMDGITRYVNELKRKEKHDKWYSTSEYIFAQFSGNQIIRVLECFLYISYYVLFYILWFNVFFINEPRPAFSMQNK